ncbi:MAG: LAGLIDADG family homing endonuclease [Candidatus Woesearchaeota archaeon]
MVLEKLGDSLKNTLSKIASAVFIDEKLVNELIKDLQRALLHSDVNVRLVMELSQKIKTRVLKEEIPPALTKKEYLMNVVYEELTNFLGGEGYKINIEKKPFKIMLVGLFGNGKCVHKDSSILLWDGQTINAEKLYNIYKEKGEFKLEDGFIVPLENEIYVPSMNTKTLRIEKKRVSCIWKLKGKELVEVQLDNGNNFNIKTTPEHPFFILDKGEVKQKRADELKKGEHIAIPTNYISEPRYFEFNKILGQQDLDIYIDKERAKEIKKNILRKYGSLKNALRKLKYKRNYIHFTHALKQGQIPIYFINQQWQEKVTIKHYKAQDIITYPTRLKQELAEFIGYIIGDGYLSASSVNISTEDDEIIERIKELSHKLFSKKPTLTRDKRRKKLVNIRINSYTLVNIIHNTFNIPIGKKGRKLEIPRLIQESDLKVIKSFIRAYFDCDAHFSPKQRQIELVSESKIMIKQIHHMLLRFNILGTQIRKKMNNQEYYRLMIQSRYALRFGEKIHSLIKRKQKALESYSLMTLKQGDGKQDMIPVGDLLQKLRESAGYSINQIQRHVSSYGLYENNKRISKTQLQKVVSFYEKKRKGNNLHILSSLKNLADSDLSWIKVNKADKIENNSKFVYDLTVEDNHNFIADGIIVHNTTTAGKLGKFFQKRGLKVALVQTDTWRPAAYEQLIQLGKQINFDVYGDPKLVSMANIQDGDTNNGDTNNTDTSNKRDITKTKKPEEVYLEFAPKISKYDLVIIDTAGRDALNEELVEELNAINNTVQPDEVLLVMSADIGQAAQRQAEVFHQTCKVNGVIITKLDGTAKGGGALSACSVTNAPVKFIGVGEKIDDFEEFKPKNFVGRLLGMGDIETLLEKAKDAIKEEDAKDMSKKFLSGKFNLIDLYEQMQAMGKMGPLSKVLDMIPGMGQLKLPKDMINIQEGKLKRWRYIMDSCTRKELKDPDIIDTYRIDRIAKGSGSSVSEIRELLKQYKQSRRMMKMFKGSADSPKAMEKMMKKFKGGMPGMGNMKFK